MKSVKLSILLFIGVAISFTSCLKDSCSEKRTLIEFESVFVKPEDFRIDVTFVASRKLENPGKIYYHNDRLFINEQYEGVHIYDNSDPKAPVYNGYLSIPGNLDISISGDIMYADNYVDLITIDISDLQNPNIVDRDEETFTTYTWRSEELGYFVYVKETPRTLEIDCNDPNFNNNWFWRNNNVFADENAFPSGEINIQGNTQGNGTSKTGVGGSFARFAVIDDYLYVLNSNEIHTFSLSSQSNPTPASEIFVDWGTVETLFPYGDHLFIGGTQGMHIYDRSNPAEPSYVSRFEHARACDPVVVQGTTAYVTLRNGSRCESFTNQLDVIDITNISNPQLIISHEMDNPHGLAVVDDYLYICDGDEGLKVFDKSDSEKISDRKLAHMKDFNAYDIIPLTKSHMIIVGANGLFQYDSSDPENMEQLSFIPVWNQ